MIKLAPSILSADFARLLEDVKKVENAGCEYLHIDVMDGHFVPNITLGPNVVKSLRKDVDMVFDAHLMIENPDQYIKEFVDAGCDIIVVHQEACRHLHRTIQNIKSYGIKAGVSLNPATPIETIKHIIRDVDKSEVIDSNLIESPVLGKISPLALSGGTKTLILIINDKEKIFNASTCGNNCAKWLLKISENEDVTINLRHLMDFGAGRFNIKVLNTDKIVHNMSELLDEAMAYV